jgi:ribonuclease T2
MLAKVFLVTLITISCVSAWEMHHIKHNAGKGLLELRSSTQADVGSPVYDFYKFSKEWSGTTCYETKCVDDKLGAKEWNQHGLWPNQWHTFNIPGCSKETFDVSKFNAVEKKELISFWDGMFSKNEGFWAHEWTKHGTCWDANKGDLTKMSSDVANQIKDSRKDLAAGKSQQSDYFHLVYFVQKPLDFYKVLGDAGIKPATQTYTFDAIKSALQKGFNVQHMDIICKKSKEGDSMLSEVRLCVDLNYNVMDCPTESRRCGDDVLYPPHTTS